MFASGLANTFSVQGWGASSDPEVEATPGHNGLLVINIEDVREWISEHLQCSGCGSEL
jgi:hypothetical protein